VPAGVVGRNTFHSFPPVIQRKPWGKSEIYVIRSISIRVQKCQILFLLDSAPGDVDSKKENTDESGMKKLGPPTGYLQSTDYPIL
jgi:hypothetical protein